MLDICRRDGLFQRSRDLWRYWEDAAHGLKGLPHVVDIRNIGLLAAIELAPLTGKPGQRGYAVHQACLERGCLIRSAGDTMLLSPPLIIEPAQIDELFSVPVSYTHLDVYKRQHLAVLDDACQRLLGACKNLVHRSNS